MLLVDDDPSVLLTTEAILADAHDVTTAVDGEAAIALLRSRAFDVVCTDYEMRGRLTGLDVITYAASLPHFVGKVLATGQPHRIADGAGFYVLAKPYDADRLLQIVERAGAQARAQRRAAVIKGEAKHRESGRYGSVDEPHGPTGREPIDGVVAGKSRG